MLLGQALAALGIEDAPEVFEPHWEESEATFPAGLPGFLRDEQVVANREYTRLPEAIEPVLRDIARQARETPALAHLAWHCHQLLYTHSDYDSQSVGRWPTLTRLLGRHADAFWMLVATGVVELVRAVHATRSVPDKVTRDTCGHFGELLWNYQITHPGQWGVPLRVLYWQRHYVSGELYTLGRMEYMVRPFRYPVHVYRKAQTGEVLALAGDGCRFAPDGYMTAVADDGAGWTSRLVQEPDAVTGCPIAPTGVGLRQEVTLSLLDWVKVLGPDDGVLDTHIPAGGNMTPERCRDTMQRGLDFFPRHFPDRPFVGFACGSWILNPELEAIYSPDSNMVLWQRELYLFPIPSSLRSGLYFMFGTDDVDPDTAPRDTSLRRAVLDHLKAGGRLIVGGMFFLTQDMPRYGTQPYRSRWPVSALR